MNKITKEKALKYHALERPGKIEVRPTKPYSTQEDLSLAYSPGVAFPCLEIKKQAEEVYKYTDKGNLVAVITNGTAVLGLGNIGAMSGKPVMEGKGMLFKIYAGIDVFDIEIDEKDPDKFCEIVERIAPSFGGINLEDIKAQECFYIEDRLRKNLDIPVMHDDQHGTAIISAAGLINALEIAGKKPEDIKMVVNGAGAAAISCCKLYMAFGVRKENIIMLDSAGVITSDRQNLTPQKYMFRTDRKDVHNLPEAIRGADVFIGLSKGNVLTQDMIRSMAENPIVFALANPIPEISYEDAMASRPDVIMATGRSDYPNQINNVLGFPYIFRGALDVRATTINEEMKLAAAKAIAALTKKPVPDIVNNIYRVNDLKFGRDYIIPKPVDPRLITEVSMAVAKAAIDSGVAKKEITDWTEYEWKLKQLMGQESNLSITLNATAKRHPQRVVFAEGSHPNMMKAAAQAMQEGICFPILLGNEEELKKIAKEEDVSLEGIRIVDLRSDNEEERRRKFARQLCNKHARNGYTFDEAYDKMYERNYFGMSMVEAGDADAFITGIYTKYSNTIKVAKEVIGVRYGFDTFATMHILNTKRGLYYIADTLINRHPDEKVLYDVARLTANTVRIFNAKPVMAMVSFSNFGTDKDGSPREVHKAVERLQSKYKSMCIDGEMQVKFALNKELRDEKYPFTRLKGKDVNTLIFPNLSSANSCYQALKALDPDAEVVGPIEMGLNKPIHFTDFEASVRDIVNVTAVAAINAYVLKLRNTLRNDRKGNDKAQ